MTILLSHFLRRPTFLLLFVVFLFGDIVEAQPQYSYDPGTGKVTNTIPFNASASGSNRRQTLYYPADFNNAVSGFITKVYFQASAPVSPSMSDVQISFATTNATSLATGPFITSGLTQAYHVATFSSSSLPGNWIAFTLQTPFLWDMTTNLIVDAQHGGFTTGFTINQTITTGRSLFGKSTATSANGQDRLTVFGFDMAPSGACTMPPFVGNTTSDVAQVCANNIVSLAIDTMSYGQGQHYMWQFSTDSIAWQNLPNDTLISTVTAVASTRWYRCRVTCGTSTSFSHPKKIIVIGTPIAGGTYTINSGVVTGGSNFASFSAFFSSIKCGGIAGPIVLNVAPNMSGYYEQLHIKSISGSSAVNTITINGNGAVLKHEGGTANRGTLTLDGTSYIIIKNLTIEGTGLLNSYGVELRNNTRNLTFDSCTVRANLSATSSATGAFMSGNNAINPTAAGLATTQLTVTNCLIEGGYYAMMVNGPTSAPWSANNIIENNEIRDFYVYGLYLRGQENSSIKNNDIHRSNAANYSSFYGLYLLDHLAGTAFMGNTIHNSNDNGTAATTNYAIFISGGNATASNPAVFSNNAIYNINNTGALYGVYVNDGDYLKFYHNTISLISPPNNPTTGSVRAIFFAATSGHFELKNNLIHLDNSGTGTKHLLYVNSALPNYVFNNNQYFFSGKGGTNVFGYYGGAQVPDFNAWKALSNGAYDQNSVFGDPIFSTAQVFTPQTSIGNAAGANLLAQVHTDIFGTARTATPDIGAVEYTPLACLQPLNFSATSTATAISVSWTNDPSADSVHIEYGVSGFNQGTGTGVNVSGTSFTATSLNSETCYDFYVYSWCNGVAGNGTSLFTHCTDCGARPIPLIENFDTSPGGVNATVPNTPKCWTNYKSGNLTAVYGYNYTGLAPRSTPNHWRMYNGANTTDTIALVTPELAGLNIGDKRVRFWAKSNATSFTRFVVGTVASPDQMHTFAPIDTFLAAQNYTEFMLSFNVADGYNGTHNYVVFMMRNTSSSQALYLDDIRFELVPLCAPAIGVNTPTVATTSAAVSWGSVRGNCFRVEYGPAGFKHSSGQGTVINNAVAPQTITGLQPNTQYDVYVFDCCNYAAASQVHTFRTACTSQLSGTIVINKNATPSATTFLTFDGFLQTLKNCGLSGPLVVNVVAGSGPYIEEIIIDSIRGISATNTITINGNGNILTYASGNPAQRATLTLDASSYLTIKDLTIESTGSTNAYAIEYRNKSHHIVLDNCTIKVSTTATINSVNALVFSDNPTSPTATSGVFHNNSIKNSIVEGGFYGIVLNGPAAAPWSYNNLIENTEVRDFYAYGLWVCGQQNTTIRGNNIHRANRIVISTLYGMYITGGSEGLKITENRVHNIADVAAIKTLTSYPYCFSGAVGTAANPIIFANNLMYAINTTSVIYGLYISGVSNHLKIYHNTLSLENYGASLNNHRLVFMNATSGNFELKNNIFSLTSGSTGAKHLVYLNSTLPNYVFNNNQYYIDGAGTPLNNSVGYWGGDFNTFATWKTANNNAFEANGVYGDPSFGTISTGNLTPIGVAGNNAGQNLLAQVPKDYYGVARTATPDIGAIEFTPVTADISLSAAQLTKGLCLSTADTVMLDVTNITGGTIDFSTHPLTASWTLTGPVSSTGTIFRNTGTLPNASATTLFDYTANLSVPGTYTLKAWIAPNAVNLLAINDTISNVVFDVLPVFGAYPKTVTVTNTTDSVEVNINSPFFAGDDFFITEVCQMRTTMGIPTTSWPSYLIADDYIEITGIPGSDLSGITLEQWSTTAMLGSYTFPAGTLLSPNGTAIIAVGQLGGSVSSPVNFYYHGNGNYTGSFAGGAAVGRILKSANNAIIDAVGFAGYVFPAISGVTAADWSNSPTVGNSTNGTRLQGPDLNSGTNWVVSSAAFPQNPNVINLNVSLPNPKSVSGFSWSLNGVVIDTNVNIFVGPWATAGVYYYVATLHSTSCGTLTDTVTITVSLPMACLPPANAVANATNCTTTTLNWTSAPSALSTKIEYGNTGFAVGTGTVILSATAPQLISGLTIGTGYDFFMRDSCASGKSGVVKVSETTTSGPMPTASGSFAVVGVSISGADVQFDGSTSANYTTLTWDFGDLTPMAMGVNLLHTYTANGTYTVTLIAESDCGTDTTTFNAVISGIGLLEHEVFNHFNVYPNPSLDNFSIEFSVDKPTSIEVRVVSLQGQILYTKIYGVTNSIFKEAISLEGTPAGTYLLQIFTEQGTVTRRIMIQK